MVVVLVVVGASCGGGCKVVVVAIVVVEMVGTNGVESGGCRWCYEVSGCK